MVIEESRGEAEVSEPETPAEEPAPMKKRGKKGQVDATV